MTTYKDERPGGSLIRDGDVVAPPLPCKSCREPLNVDMEQIVQDPTYQAACLACGCVHGFIRHNGVLLYGLPLP